LYLDESKNGIYEGWSPNNRSIQTLAAKLETQVEGLDVSEGGWGDNTTLKRRDSRKDQYYMQDNRQRDNNDFLMEAHFDSRTTSQRSSFNINLKTSSKSSNVDTAIQILTMPFAKM
jgi:hypothetical protein